MNPNNKKTYTLLFLFVGLLGIATLVWVFNPSKTKLLPLAKKHTLRLALPDTTLVYDSLLLKKIKQLCQKTNGFSGSCSGNITLHNPQDSSQNMYKLPFTFVSNQGNSYYRVGVTEVFNVNGLNVVVGHQQKTIILSNQKAMPAPMAFNVQQLVHKLQAGEYKLQSKTRGKYKTISMLNPRNMDCSEYSLSYDTLKMQINRVLTRIPDINNPFNKNKDKVMDVRITSASPTSTIKPHVLIAKIVHKHRNSWQLSASYSSYQLVQQ